MKGKQNEVVKKGHLIVVDFLQRGEWFITARLHRTKSSYSIANANNSVRKTVRIRTLSKRNPVPMGHTLLNYDEDLLLICRNLDYEPEFYIIPMEEAIKKTSRKIKNGVESFWIEPPDYKDYQNNWNALDGRN